MFKSTYLIILSDKTLRLIIRVNYHKQHLYTKITYVCPEYLRVLTLCPQISLTKVKTTKPIS